MLIVVILSKFKDGAWLSILIMALLVPLFYAIHRHYTWVRSAVHRGSRAGGCDGTDHMVLLVRDVDAAVAEALGYVRSFRPRSLRALTPRRPRCRLSSPSGGRPSPAPSCPAARGRRVREPRR